MESWIVRNSSILRESKRHQKIEKSWLRKVQGESVKDRMGSDEVEIEKSKIIHLRAVRSWDYLLDKVTSVLERKEKKLKTDG